VTDCALRLRPTPGVHATGEFISPAFPRTFHAFPTFTWAGNLIAMRVPHRPWRISATARGFLSNDKMCLRETHHRPPTACSDALAPYPFLCSDFLWLAIQTLQRDAGTHAVSAGRLLTVIVTNCPRSHAPDIQSRFDYIPLRKARLRAWEYGKDENHRLYGFPRDGVDLPPSSQARAANSSTSFLPPSFYAIKRRWRTRAER